MPRIPICVDNRPRIRFAHPINAWTIVAAHPRIRCAAHPIRVDNRSRIRIGCGADFLHISNPGSVQPQLDLCREPVEIFLDEFDR